MKFFVRDGKGSTKQKALLIMISIMALVVQPVYGLIASQSANAVGETVVTPTSMNGWTVSASNGGSATFQSPTDSTGALKISLANGNSRVRVNKPVDVPLATVSNISFKGKLLSGPTGSANTVFRLGMDYDGNGPGTVQWIVYETYYNFDSVNTTNSTTDWQTWNVKDGKFWGAWNAAGDYATNKTLSEILAANPDAVIKEISVGMGAQGFSLSTPWQSLVDTVSFNGATFDFQPASIVACTTTSNIHSTSLSSWNTSDTSTDGSASNQLTSSGLRVKTEAAGHRKAAGYYPVDFKLGALGTDSIADILTMNVNSGAKPGAQLVVDFDGDSISDGILVGETIYGNNWWLSNSAAQFVKDGSPKIGGGNGSSWFGTASEWLNAFPNATVKAIGYSLGSGMTGDVTITKITAGCTTYTFGPIAPTVTITTPSEAGSVNTKQNGNNVTVTGKFTDDKAVNYLQLELVKDGNLVTVYTMHYNNAGLHSDGTFSVSIPVAANIAEGPYSLFYTGTDFDGGVTARMERKFLIDNTAPNTPNNLRLQVRSTGNFVGQNGWTNHSDVTALWNGNNTEAVTYEYQYWNDVTTSSWKSDNHWKTNSATASYAGTVNEGEGKHYYCVVAIDLAGNRSNCSAPFSFNYDATDPMTDIVVSPVVNGKFTVSGDASDNISLNRVYVQLVHRQTGVRYGGTTINLIGKGKTAEWSVEYTISDLPQGSYAAHVEATDMAGNRGAAGSTDNFFVDRTAPGVEILNMAAVNPSSFDIKATDAVGLKRIDYSLWTNSNTTQLGVWGAWISGTEFNDSGISQYTSNVDLSKKYFADLPDGEYTLRATAGDMAGNSKNAENFNFVVDRTAPKVTVNPIANSTNTTPVITGTVDEPGLNVTILIDGKEEAPVTSDEDGKWSWTPTTPFQVGGPYTVVAVATDAAGNTSSSDTSAPQPYWTQFAVTAPVITNPDDDQTSSNPDEDIDRGPVAAASTNPPITNPNDGDGDNTTTNDTTTTDGSEDTDVLAESTTDNSDNEGQVLAAQDEKGNWSIVNLVLSAATILLSLVALIGLARRKEEGEDNHKLVRILTLIPVAIAATAFLLIEDLSASAIWFNWWTALYAVVLAVQIAIVSSLKNSREY